jgi:hypothetical protein
MHVQQQTGLGQASHAGGRGKGAGTVQQLQAGPQGIQTVCCCPLGQEVLPRQEVYVLITGDPCSCWHWAQTHSQLVRWGQACVQLVHDPQRVVVAKDRWTSCTHTCAHTACAAPVCNNRTVIHATHLSSHRPPLRHPHPYRPKFQPRFVHTGRCSPDSTSLLSCATLHSWVTIIRVAAR